MLKVIRLTVSLQAFGYLFQFAAFFLFAKMLGPEFQGILSIFRSTGQIIASLLLLGLPGGIIYFVGKNRNLFNSVINNCLKLLIITFPILILCLYTQPAKFLITKFAIGNYIPYLIILIFFLSCLGVFEASILSIKKYLFYNLFMFASGAIILFFSVAVWFIPLADNKLLLSILGYIATYSIMFIYGAFLVFREGKEIYNDRIKQSFRKHLQVGIKGFLSTISALLLYRLDLFLVGYFLSLKEVGIYSIALFSIEILTKIPAWSAAVLTPMVAGNESGHIKRTIYLFYSAIIGTLFIGVIYLFAISISNNFISNLIGKDFSGVEICMLFLLPRVVMQSGVVVLAANLAGKGYPWYHPIGCSIPLVILCLLDIYLIPVFGINGAAIGNSLAYISAVIFFWKGFIKYNKRDEIVSFKSYWQEIRGYFFQKLSLLTHY